MGQLAHRAAVGRIAYFGQGNLDHSDQEGAACKATKRDSYDMLIYWLQQC